MCVALGPWLAQLWGGGGASRLARPAHRQCYSAASNCKVVAAPLVMVCASCCTMQCDISAFALGSSAAQGYTLRGCPRSDRTIARSLQHYLVRARALALLNSPAMPNQLASTQPLAVPLHAAEREDPDSFTRTLLWRTRPRSRASPFPGGRHPGSTHRPAPHAARAGSGQDAAEAGQQVRRAVPPLGRGCPGVVTGSPLPVLFSPSSRPSHCPCRGAPPTPLGPLPPSVPHNPPLAGLWCTLRQTTRLAATWATAPTCSCRTGSTQSWRSLLTCSGGCLF